jgi:glycosyltransferase involved in cell wall biosynthesis
MDRTARFSIIITSFNQREFIRDAVDSALSLSADDREIIVVDDASTDASQDVLGGYYKSIRFLPLEINRGRSGARNHGAAVATGDYLVFLDGDDVFAPWAMSVYRRVVQAKHPNLIISPMLWFSGPLPDVGSTPPPSQIRAVEYPDYLQKDRPFGVSASSVVVDRQSFQRMRGWSEDLAVLEDQDFVMRLGESGRTVHVLSPPTTFHRKHPGQTINQVRPFIRVLSDLIRREHEGQYPGGPHRRFKRYAFWGGLVFFWGKRAAKAGLWSDAAALLTRNIVMVGVAILHRVNAVLKGKRPEEVIDL